MGEVAHGELRLRMDLRDRREDSGPTGSKRFQKSTPGRKEDLGSNAGEKDQ